MKSINQYYNKKKAEIQSIYDKQGIKIGHKILVLNYKRNNKIKDAMHKISRFIINYCIEHNIGIIVIGHNDKWKQKVNIGKRNNQNFVSIPYHTLIHDITYKAEEVGIKVIEQEESHTSNLINQCHLFFIYYSLIYQKCSFLDDEPIEHHDKYLGRRIKRGIFRSAKGILINADVQGALNIIKKAFPKAFRKALTENVDGIEGLTHSDIYRRLYSECVKGYTHCDTHLVLSHKHKLNNLFSFDSLPF